MLNKIFEVICFHFNIFSTKTAKKQVLKFEFWGFSKCPRPVHFTLLLSIMIKNQHFKNCFTRVNLFPYAIEICKSSQQKCLKLQKGYSRKFLQTLSFPETSSITICAILLVLRCSS